MCLVTAGIGTPCKTVRAGIKRLLIADETVLEPTFTDNTITAFTAATVYEFLIDSGEGGATASGTNERSGTPFYTHTVTANFHVNTSAKQAQIDNIVAGRKRVIIEDFSEKYWVLGLDVGMATQVEQLFGTAPGDPTGNALTMTAEESTPAIECTAAIGDLTITAASLT